MSVTMINPERVPKRKLNTGAEMPCIGMGTFGSDRYNAAQISSAVEGAIALGYRLFDCASVYGNEAEIGKVFKRAIEKKIVSREELFIMSKVWNDMHGDGQVIASCHQTLRDLQTDYLDAFFVHWPFPNYHAPGCDGDSRSADARPFIVEEFMSCWRQMEELYDKGLVRHIAMSNMTIPKLEAVLPLCRIKPSLIEMELHPGFQQKALFDYALQHDIQPVGFCPLGSPSRPERDKTADDVVDMDMPSVVAAAKNHGIHPAQVCLKWSVQIGAIPIPFSVHEEKYAGNLACILDDPLSDEEMEAIRRDDRNCRLIKGQVFLWEGSKDWHDLWDENGVINNV